MMNGRADRYHEKILRKYKWTWKPGTYMNNYYGYYTHSDYPGHKIEYGKGTWDTGPYFIHQGPGFFTKAEPDLETYLKTFYSKKNGR
jgi:hypothetical protein